MDVEERLKKAEDLLATDDSTKHVVEELVNWYVYVNSNATKVLDEALVEASFKSGYVLVVKKLLRDADLLNSSNLDRLSLDLRVRLANEQLGWLEADHQSVNNISRTHMMELQDRNELVHLLLYSQPKGVSPSMLKPGLEQACRSDSVFAINRLLADAETQKLDDIDLAASDAEETLFELKKRLAEKELAKSAEERNLAVMNFLPFVEVVEADDSSADHHEESSDDSFYSAHEEMVVLSEESTPDRS